MCPSNFSRPAPLGDLSPEGSAVIYVLRSEEGHRAQKMELPISGSTTSNALDNSTTITGANLLNGVEKNPTILGKNF